MLRPRWTCFADKKRPVPSLPPAAVTWRRIEQEFYNPGNVIHTNPHGSKHINDATQRKLDAFYGKYNRELADLLRDERFLWRAA